MNYFETNLEEISRSIQLLAQIFEYQVFELQVEEKDGNQTGYVPYMMNDAIECYLSFHGLRISGKYDKDYEGEMWAQLEEREGRYGLIVHQGEESVFTMWFDEIMEHTNCYRYHEIGHFWRDGAEQWRQLVYMIGTIREKYRFLGEQVDKKLKEQGFTGSYPQYESEHLSVCVTEEHPFTILESEDFKFKIQLMISECREKHPRKNAGFFKGYQRKGKIKRLDF